MLGAKGTKAKGRLFKKSMLSLPKLNKALASINPQKKGLQNSGRLELTEAEKTWAYDTFHGRPDDMTRFAKAFLQMTQSHYDVSWQVSPNRHIKISMHTACNESHIRSLTKLLHPIMKNMKGLSWASPGVAPVQLCYVHKNTCLLYYFILSMEWLLSHDHLDIKLARLADRKYGFGFSFYAQKSTIYEAAEIRVINFLKRHDIPDTPFQDIGISEKRDIASHIRIVTAMSFGISDASCILDATGTPFQGNISFHVQTTNENSSMENSGIIILSPGHNGVQRTSFCNVNFRTSVIKGNVHIHIPKTWKEIIPSCRSISSLNWKLLPHIKLTEDLYANKCAVNHMLHVSEGDVVDWNIKPSLDKKDHNLARIIKVFLGYRTNAKNFNRTVSFAIQQAIRLHGTDAEKTAFKILKSLGLSGTDNHMFARLEKNSRLQDICRNFPMAGALFLSIHNQSTVSYFSDVQGIEDLSTFRSFQDAFPEKDLDIFREMKISPLLQKDIFRLSPRIAKKAIFRDIIACEMRGGGIAWADLAHHYMRFKTENRKENILIIIKLMKMLPVIEELKIDKCSGSISDKDIKSSLKFELKDIWPSYSDIEDAVQGVVNVFYKMVRKVKGLSSVSMYDPTGTIRFLIETGIIRPNAIIGDMNALSEKYHSNNADIATAISRMKSYGLTSDEHDITTWLPLHEPWSCRHGTLTFMTTRERLEKESQDMSHCVRSYGDTCYGYESFIAHIQGTDGTASTLELMGIKQPDISFPGKFLDIRQNKSIRNAAPSGESEKTLAAYLKSDTYKDALNNKDIWESRSLKAQDILRQISKSQTEAQWIGGMEREWNTFQALLFPRKVSFESVKRILVEKYGVKTEGNAQ